MTPATVTTPRGALGAEAALLQSRVHELRGMVRRLPALAEVSVVDAVTRLRPFINYLAAHGRAEEHILYPYAESAGGTGLTSLRNDHMRLERLDTAEAHLALESDRCLSVVHERSSARAERYLCGEIEIETFETVPQ